MHPEEFIDRIIEDHSFSFKQILIVFLCFLFNLLDGFDITAMAVVAKSVGQDLVIAADQLGWIFSFALVGMMIGAMILAPLSDLFGRRTLIISSLIIVGVSIVLTGYADSLMCFALSAVWVPAL